MKHLFTTLMLLTLSVILFGQDGPVSPGIIKTAVYFDISPPLSDLPPITAEEMEIMKEKALKKAKNKGLGDRIYPFTEKALPKGPDEAWQKEMGTKSVSKAPIANFAGQSSPYYPPDCNGDVGPNHYFQTVNTTYAIYNKTGTLLAGPTAMNSLFSGVTGATYNDGDPIVLYDEHADRWLAAEFSISGSNDYMLIAVSITPDPTGTWYRWSFDVDDTPDYMKFGIQRDGYYMATNTYNGNNNAYVFERDVMLVGGGSPTMVGFPNPWRPPGFHCIQPIDCDAAFPPVGASGQFITINDDGINGSNDELRIFELDVNWTTPELSTFNLVQQLSVTPFDSEFNAWGVGDIAQPVTSQLLDAIPMVLMYRAQYRNFGSSQNVVCMHTVDVDDSNHAGIRWYELENTSGTWSIRQQGTYAPDAHSRWMGSIAMNAQHAIGMGYTVSSSSVYPSIRYCGQSPAENATASGILDIAEENIQTSVAYQTAYTRWGDYSFMAIDPIDNNTFWYTSEYLGSGATRQTRIAAFELSDAPLTSDFYADLTTVCTGGAVNFTDASLGVPITWSWGFPGGTPSTSSLQNPVVTYNSAGTYTVTLTVGDGVTTNDIVKTNYITVQNVIADFTPSSLTVAEGSTLTFTDNSSCSPTTWNWTFAGGTPASYSGANPPAITYNTLGNFNVTLEVIKGAYSDTKIIPIEVIPLSYCTPTYSTGTSWGDYISLVQLGSINNATGASSSPYYTYYSSLSTDLTQEESYTITLSPGTYSSGNYLAVWMDYNRDGTFNATTEKLGTILINAAAPATGTINFTVPTDANVGTTRMRVREVYATTNFDACTQYSYGETEDYNINVLSKDLRLDITVKLEGPYNPSTNLMETTLNSMGYLPTLQPYNPPTPYYGNPNPIWQYLGTESVISIPVNVVDWVVVQLRDSSSPGNASSATTLDTQAGLLLSNGTIVSTDGVSPLLFDVTVTQGLFVVIYHRNHLGVISNVALTEVGGIYSYDFSTGENQAYGGLSAHKQLEPGVWGMVAADGDANGTIQLGDKNGAWLTDFGISGYLGGDFDMNSVGQLTDKNVKWLNNLGTGGQIPAKGAEVNSGYRSQVPK